MSRNTIILLVVLCGGIAGLIAFSKLRSKDTAPAGDSRPIETAPAVNPPPKAGLANSANKTSRTGEGTVPVAGTPPNIAAQQGTSAVDPKPAVKPLTLAPLMDDPPITKPVPVLEKDYATATNRDTRLDIMMDIAESPGPEAVKALTRLFEAETDAELKIDLLDSLLGIDGYKDEKLIMLTMGARPGLPSDVRQSAIDGLIDLEDPRAVPILNGLLNDPDPEIREGAKDALEILQSEPPAPGKLIK
jgi:hypothetical protein